MENGSFSPDAKEQGAYVRVKIPFFGFLIFLLDKYPIWVYSLNANIPVWGILRDFKESGNKMEQQKKSEKITKKSCGACCHQKATPREEASLKLLKNRINRMTGQLNGISKMLDENRYCGDILIQLAAVESALQSFSYIILKEHMETCVVEEIREGNLEVIGEAVELIKKIK